MEFRALSNEDLLDALTKERNNLIAMSWKNEATIAKSVDNMKAMVDLLVERGVYPHRTVSGRTVLDMVNGWGARWHVWSGVKTPMTELQKLEYALSWTYKGNFQSWKEYLLVLDSNLANFFFRFNQETGQLE